MAEQVKLAAAVREGRGKGPAKRLRRTGRVPAVLYGSGVDTTPLDVDARDLHHALHTSAGLNAIIRLDVAGEEHLTIAREVQHHPVRGDLFHVDFVAVRQSQLVNVDVPIHLLGTEDVSAPGVVTQTLHALPIRVRPLDIPDFFELEVGEMVIGDVKRVGDLTLPEGAETELDPEEPVVTISAPSEIEEEPTEEAPEDADEAETTGDGEGASTPAERGDRGDDESAS